MRRAVIFMLLGGFLAPATTIAQELSTSRPDVGRVSGNVYANDWLAFRYQFPEGWRIHTIGEGKGKPDSETGRDVYLLVRLQDPRVPRRIGQIDIRAVDVSRSPLAQTDLILPDESPRERNKDLKRKRGPTSLTLAGRQFIRTDFEMRWRGVVVLYETKFTTVLGQYALVFTLMAGDETLRDQLLKTMDSLDFLGAKTH